MSSYVQCTLCTSIECSYQNSEFWYLILFHIFTFWFIFQCWKGKWPELLVVGIQNLRKFLVGSKVFFLSGHPRRYDIYLETFEAEFDEEWWEDECDPGLRREYSHTELAPAAKSDWTMANCSGIQRDPLWRLLICDTCRPSDRWTEQHSGKEIVMPKSSIDVHSP